MIQDIILSITTIFFGYALVPQIIYGFKSKRGLIDFKTGLITFIGLYISSVCFFTLGLFFSATLNIFTASCWLVLFLQRLKYGEVKFKEGKEDGKLLS